ncbi:protein-export membrane protein SecF [Candidatus Nomurabacteria bacterium RIFCSPLOWO2_02_FULL_40_10]|uniref:Protein-export membrane protein SecF n=1 Tax=Candidatus Nomurabacteria bacterium RIFCSPLOWO2_02_FULL_40_10 TaxID=1801786 RepID=A0A1F6XZ85_9BACT|nr:MAG: protein-export membrane protein SecF [Candidatus Nomurabacteria bacterium RIFCSPLOWO2_02_FULL_40_10]
MFDLVKHKNKFLGVSAVFVIFGIASMAIFGFRLAVDFTGGSLWQIKVPGSDVQKIEELFKSDLNLPVSGISFDRAENIYAVTLGELSDDDRQASFEIIKSKFSSAEDLDFWRVSPSVSKELKQKSMTAVVLVMVAISLYVAFVFRKVSKPVSSWKYGLITLITLAHDVIIPAGVFALLGKFIGIAVDTNFIVALLVVMGFSVHDTIVVFDRIRENLTKARTSDISLENIVNISVNETFVRSINTSLTLVLVLLSLYFWGPAGLQYFVLTMLVGTVVGTYSSIFVASPLLVVAHKFALKRG